MIQQKKTFTLWLITLLDIITVVTSYWFAIIIRGLFETSANLPPFYIPGFYSEIFPVFLITFIPIIYINNSYLKEFPVNKYKYYTRTIISIFVATLIAVVLLYYFKLFNQSRIALIIFFIISIILLILSREIISKKQKNSIYTIILGSRKFKEEIEKAFKYHALFGIKIIRVFEEVPDNFTEILKNESIDWVVVTDSSLKNYISKCQSMGITTSYYLKKEYHDVASFVTLEHSLSFPILTFHSSPQQIPQLFLKYTADRIISLTLLVLLFPVLIFISVLIKLTSHGPVIYRHIRSGHNGRKFTMLKFRTMYEGADIDKGKFSESNIMDKVVFKMQNDPRITKVGRLLRKYSLDELPQLINVLKGEMSLVGPRPPLPEEVENYEGWERKRLSMKPGLTCIWQVEGRSKISFDDWMKLDMEYIENWSLLLDFIILLKTIPAVIHGRGAY